MSLSEVIYLRSMESTVRLSSFRMLDMELEIRLYLMPATEVIYQFQLVVAMWKRRSFEMSEAMHHVQMKASQMI